MPGNNIEPQDNPESDSRYCLKRRRTIKAQITNFHTFIDAQQAAPEYDHIKSRMESLIDFFTEFKTIQIRLETREPENEDHDKAREDIEARYCHAIGRARALMKQCANTAGVDRDLNINETGSQSITRHTKHKILPPLSPPTFDGKIENWSNFKSRFISMISQNKELSNSDKLEYLQSSLLGRAARVIESLETDGSNFEDAWELLINKYDHTRKAILRHVSLLIKLPPLKTHSAEEIEEFVDTVHQHLRSLKNLMQSGNTDQQNVENARQRTSEPISHGSQFDYIIIGLLTVKIGSELTNQWELSLPDNKMPPFKSLLDFLAKRASCSEVKPTNSSRFNTERSNKPNKGVNDRGGKGHQSFTTDVKTPECPQCKARHLIYQCPKFLELTIEERIKTAQNVQLCLNCLRGQHKTKSCNSKGRCRVCDKLHHTMLHLQRDQTTPASS